MPLVSTRLKVNIETQADNACGEGWRECFTSSCAAIARFWGKVSGDDEYDRIRQRFGDTTNPQAQVQALRSLGLVGRFMTNGTPELLKAEIAAGRPVAVGWIHKGALPSGLRGDGHWTVAMGYDDRAVWMMDPNGEADMIGGGYVTTGRGQIVPYSWENWRRRWEVREVPAGWQYAPGSGWALTVSNRA